MASEEQGKKISDDLMKQIIETGEKAGEMGFMRLDTGDPELLPAEQINKALDEGKFLGEFPDLPAGWKVDALPEKPNTVPLTIYIGNEKYIVGTATVLGRKVHAQITSEDGRKLERLVTEGIITGVSVYFDKAGPVEAAEILPFDQVIVGTSKEIKYNFEPTNPMKHIPMAEGLRVTHEIVDEITYIKEAEPWQDKYPYGKA